MTESGFATISTEWWHFDDADWRRYPLLSWEFEVLDPAGGTVA
jgi:D-alanyl-D-alanine dipeptidase